MGSWFVSSRFGFQPRVVFGMISLPVRYRSGGKCENRGSFSPKPAVIARRLDVTLQNGEKHFFYFNIIILMKRIVLTLIVLLLFNCAKKEEKEKHFQPTVLLKEIIKNERVKNIIWNFRLTNLEINRSGKQNKEYEIF
jgi:hypothetical protein